MSPIKFIIGGTSKCSSLSKCDYPKVRFSFQSWLELCAGEDCNMPRGHPLRKDTFKSIQLSPLSKYTVGNDPPTFSMGDDMKPPPETNFSPSSSSSPAPSIHQFWEDTWPGLRKNRTRVGGNDGDSGMSGYIAQFEEKPVRDCFVAAEDEKSEKHLMFLIPKGNHRFSGPESLGTCTSWGSGPGVGALRRFRESSCMFHPEWIQKLGGSLVRRFFSCSPGPGDDENSEKSRCIIQFPEKPTKNCFFPPEDKKYEKHLPFLTAVDSYRFNGPKKSVELTNFSESHPNIQTFKHRLSKSPCISNSEWMKKCVQPLSSNLPPKVKRKFNVPQPARVLPISRKSSEWKNQKSNIRGRISKCPLTKWNNTCPSGAESTLREPSWIPVVTDISLKVGRSKVQLEQMPELEGNLCCHLGKCRNLKNYEMKMEESRAVAKDNKKK
ncbi:uncharacterized protein LOC135169680 [Diachasmimorpha longicaudata]|uniref:uncharacterized protein LOC135169680 n=1 Tax=Diachasmimorpha longicaudata TaxID=58733 RepID=UPI0030B8A9C8